ncbi:MAG: hypothetical protein HOP96_11805 [Sphingomonas sp.]|nr:hypothetical protein [Sphingomonas sp.]
MTSLSRHCLAATAGAVAFCSTPALAQQKEEPAQPTETERARVSYIDLTAGLGYSTNPFLRFGDSTGSAFGRLGARGVHAWSTERSRTSLSAFVEGSTYFDDTDFKSIFSLAGETQHQTSETVTVFGSAGFSGDLSGQLSNRFLYVPPVPEVPDVTLPPPPTTVLDPDLFSFAGRQYRAYGQAGVSFRTDARSSITVSGGGSRVWFTGDLLNDYTTVFGNGSYNRSLSERTTVGVNLNVEHTTYDDTNDNSTLINPTVSISTRLSEFWDVRASAGVVFSSFDRDGQTDHSTGLSLDGSICHNSETERLCGRVGRNSSSLSRGALTTTTTAGVDWYKKLDDKQTVQVSAGATRYSSDDELVSNFSSTYLRAAASYSRKINGRLSGGADVSVRSLMADGPDPDPDLTGTLFVRYRLGDLG